jgi:hypothetical protein
MSKLDGTGLYIGHDWPQREKARELYRSGDEATKEVIRRLGWNLNLYQAAREIGTLLESATIPTQLKKRSGAPQKLSGVDKKYIWLLIERFANENVVNFGRRNIDRTVKQLFSIHPKTPWIIELGDRKLIVSSAARARRIHADAARTIRTNEKTGKFWTGLLARVCR